MSHNVTNIDKHVQELGFHKKHIAARKVEEKKELTGSPIKRWHTVDWTRGDVQFQRAEDGVPLAEYVLEKGSLFI